MRNGGNYAKVVSEFHHNQHPSGVKMVANFTRRGIPVVKN